MYPTNQASFSWEMVIGYIFLSFFTLYLSDISFIYNIDQSIKSFHRQKRKQSVMKEQSVKKKKIFLLRKVVVTFEVYFWIANKIKVALAKKIRTQTGFLIF